MSDKPSTLDTIMLWVFVILVVAVVLAHGTPTGRAFIRHNMPAHGGP